MRFRESFYREWFSCLVWRRYEQGDTELLAEIDRTNAAHVWASSEEEDEVPAVAGSIRKRPGKGAAGGSKGKKTKSKKAGDSSGAAPSQPAAFGTRKLPAELSYFERLDDIVMRAPMAVRIAIGVATGMVVGGHVGYTVLQWDFLWGGLVAVMTGWVTAAIVGFVPMLLVRLVRCSLLAWHVPPSFAATDVSPPLH